MKSFKLFWNLHKWTGLCAALILFCSATTGFLLLIKKRVDWIQPPTQAGAPGTVKDFISTQRLFEIIFTSGLPEFRTLEDIDRIDFRPSQRIFKVRSKHEWAELQVCAVTGEVLSSSWRPSDLIESIHDGSWVASWVHDWLMPPVAVALVFLALSGGWLWLEPMVRKRKRRRALESRSKD